MANANDQEIWDEVCDFYRNGCIELVSPLRPIVNRWLFFKRRIGYTPDYGNTFGCRVNFADMQRMYLRFLQIKLIRVAVAQRFAQGQARLNSLNDLRSDLRDYIQAVQDHEYMTKFSKSPDDPFIASSERCHDNKTLRNVLLDYRLTPETLVGLLADKNRVTPTGPWESSQGDNVRAITTTRGKAQKRALSIRIIGAVLGGAFLIGPMWLVVLRRHIFLSLGVTTGCVTVFGLLMAFELGELGDVFTATFAYAAILMVFVGVMMQVLISSNTQNSAGGPGSTSNSTSNCTTTSAMH